MVVVQVEDNAPPFDRNAQAAPEELGGEILLLRNDSGHCAISGGSANDHTLTLISSLITYFVTTTEYDYSQSRNIPH